MKKELVMTGTGDALYVASMPRECNYLTVLPRITFRDGKMKTMEMMPLSLGFEREGHLNGLPYHAKGDDGKKIFDILNRISKPYGIEIAYENDMIVLK